MIGIIDYGVGNIWAFSNLYKKLNYPVKIAKKAEDLKHVNKLILPGVGAFDHAMERLEQSGMKERLNELVINQKLPVIGVCVGMQMLAHSSEEGRLPGLGWIDGVVKKFDAKKISYTTHLPHMGWNDIIPISQNDLLNGLESEAKFYFLHSYYFHCNHFSDTIAVTDYGIEFSCAINKNNIYGVQFHPEKSHNYGAKLLENFARL